MTFLTEIEKSILKFIWNFKGTQIAKIIFSSNKVGGLTFPGFKFNHKATVIKHRQMEKSPKINPHIYGQIILSKGANIIQWGKESY